MLYESPYPSDARFHWWRRMLVALLATIAMLGAVETVAPQANAATVSSCTISGCDAARSANSTWKSMGYPSQRGWHDWPNGQCNFAGGTYSNYEGELPSGRSYLEFDVVPRACGAPRDAKRIVVDRSSGTVWYTPDHYTTFYKL